MAGKISFKINGFLVQHGLVVSRPPDIEAGALITSPLFQCTGSEAFYEYEELYGKANQTNHHQQHC